MNEEKYIFWEWEDGDYGWGKLDGHFKTRMGKHIERNLRKLSMGEGLMTMHESGVALAYVVTDRTASHVSSKGVWEDGWSLRPEFKPKSKK